MVREILFRGKNVDTDDWVYGSFIPDLLEVYQEDKNCDGYIKPHGKTREERLMTEVLRETVGQYTGLTDKNGVKIFEGDIVHIHDLIFKYGDPHHEFNGYVDFANGSFVILGINEVVHYRWLDYDITVIGNIHDDQELLGGM